ncbi:hypothetical protein [Flavobacterium sp. DSP2-3-1]|uniref:hypothetical protein n=1 Tax=Flavobacterium sp. DSP2-3-1 TaxID=2804620 RepID=UPI003CEF45D1
MKSSFSNIVIMCVSFASVSFAQGTAVNTDYSQKSSFLLFSKENLHLVSNTIKNQEDLLGYKKMQRDVMIQQIGSFNYVNANLKAKDINVALVQNGSDNEIFMDKNANSIVQKIVQEGQSNYVKDFSLYVNYDINMEIIQKGNNQNIQNYGTNSLSKNMKIIQSGNGASVIIINK